MILKIRRLRRSVCGAHGCSAPPLSSSPVYCSSIFHSHLHIWKPSVLLKHKGTVRVFSNAKMAMADSQRDLFKLLFIYKIIYLHNTIVVSLQNMACAMRNSTTGRHI